MMFATHVMTMESRKRIPKYTFEWLEDKRQLLFWAEFVFFFFCCCSFLVLIELFLSWAAIISEQWWTLNTHRQRTQKQQHFVFYVNVIKCLKRKLVRISLNFVAIVFVEFESFVNFCVNSVAESDARACHIQRVVSTVIQKQNNKINFALFFWFCFFAICFLLFINSIY